MNIDLRNVSEKFENNINQLKKNYGYKTNTHAVEHCVNNYLRIEEEKKELEKELEIAKRRMKSYKNKISCFKEAFEDLIE